MPDTNELEWKLKKKKKKHFDTQNTQTIAICSYMQTITDGKECNKESYNNQHKFMTWWQICKVCGRRLLTLDLNTIVRLPTHNMRLSSLIAPTLMCGPRSSVGIATSYGLDDPGIESRWGEIFRLSRPALGPTQPPVQWVPSLSRV